METIIIDEMKAELTYHAPVLTLFLDLASHKQCIAVADEKQTLALHPIDSKVDNEDMMKTIDILLAKAKITLTDIDRIAAATGPGGFMSLRVGIALANALADSLDVPLAGVHLSDVWKARTQTSNLKAHNCLWLHSTKQHLIFMKDLAKNTEPTLQKLDDLKALIQSETAYVGELLESQQKELPMLNPIADIAPLEDVLPKLLSSLTYDKKSLLPWYGRGA